MRASLAGALLVMLVGGTAHAAHLRARLPLAGDGFATPETWAERGLRYGTPELVSFIQRVGMGLHAADPDVLLWVADLSREDGAATQWHRSHRTGHDVDFILFAKDANGDPAPEPTAMIPYDANGLSPDGELRFDTAKNWLLVRLALEDRDAQVTRIFIARWHKTRLLDYATAEGESPELIARAEAVMGQPGDALVHDDHMHIRIKGSMDPDDGDVVEARTYARVPAMNGHGKHARHLARPRSGHKATTSKAKTKGKTVAKTTPKAKKPPVKSARPN